MGGVVMRARIIEHFQLHPNQIKSSDDLLDMLGRNHGPSDLLAIRNCMNSIIKDRPEIPIVVEVKGTAWSYASGKVTIRRRKFTEVGTSSSGIVIVEEDGTSKIYVLKELV
jgi:hypothetical protein